MSDFFDVFFWGLLSGCSAAFFLLISRSRSLIFSSFSSCSGLVSSFRLRLRERASCACFSAPKDTCSSCASTGPSSSSSSPSSWPSASLSSSSDSSSNPVSDGASLPLAASISKSSSSSGWTRDRRILRFNSLPGAIVDVWLLFVCWSQRWIILPKSNPALQLTRSVGLPLPFELHF